MQHIYDVLALFSVSLVYTTTVQSSAVCGVQSVWSCTIVAMFTTYCTVITHTGGVIVSSSLRPFVKLSQTDNFVSFEIIESFVKGLVLRFKSAVYQVNLRAIEYREKS